MSAIENIQLFYSHLSLRCGRAATWPRGPSIDLSLFNIFFKAVASECLPFSFFKHPIFPSLIFSPHFLHFFKASQNQFPFLNSSKIHLTFYPFHIPSLFHYLFPIPFKTLPFCPPLFPFQFLRYVKMARGPKAPQSRESKRGICRHCLNAPAFEPTLCACFLGAAALQNIHQNAALAAPISCGFRPSRGRSPRVRTPAPACPNCRCVGTRRCPHVLAVAVRGLRSVHTCVKCRVVP